MQGETGPPYSSLAKRNAKKREKISQGETGPPDSSLEEPKKNLPKLNSWKNLKHSKINKKKSRLNKL